jgi:lysophospholipase L1-like esterase
VYDFIVKYPDLFEEILPIIGQPRSASVHPSAVIVSPEYIKGEVKNCYEILPIKKMDGLLVSELTGVDIDEMGLQTDYLHGKQIMAIGDSMVRGHTVSTPWLTVLANRVGATPSNKGSNGAYMSNHLYNGSETSVYSKLCLPNSANYITDAGLTVCDYIIIFAGTNDCANDITIGDVDSNNPEEFCGAIIAICQTLQTRVPTARICFITPYLRSGIETKCQTYINAIINVCKKYNIPVFDNSTNGGINFANTAMASALTLNDNTHLNEAGHAYVSYKYEAFLRTL